MLWWILWINCFDG